MFNWLDYLAQAFVTKVIGLSMESKWGSSIHFFIYDTIKIIILLSIMIFLISYIRSYFPPEKTKRILAKFNGIKGNIMASLLGIVTPFCSCSSVPIFIGFVEAGVPLGLTFSFLITSPIVNEAAFIILLGLFGWKLAVVYVITGVIVGVLGGLIIGKMKMEKQVEEYVYNTKVADIDPKELTINERVSFATQNIKDIVKRIWLFLIIGIGIGAAIHGWVPEDFLASYAGENNPFAVLIAVVCGIPLYSNAMGTIPIAQALIGKGVGIGTALSFMMAVTALSAPELVLLRKVIKPRLIVWFVIVTGIGILMTGYLFNFIGHLLM
ncbi:permease [Vallitalea guaymasensis]|uniref:Permease n=1 Tax=Vallitalea guaymasensis TaxID=1185412 RepID=A0A8J8SAX8_9FIRM|nr:permease [Vallitalea guaymasensis]QUH27761.1 permease [Vallitalea guaymasensis]